LRQRVVFLCCLFHIDVAICDIKADYSLFKSSAPKPVAGDAVMRSQFVTGDGGPNQGRILRP
jgi:hypothetical protein